MNVKKKLANPFALAMQGFAIGAILFFAAMIISPDSADQPGEAKAAAAGTR